MDILFPPNEVGERDKAFGVPYREALTSGLSGTLLEPKLHDGVSAAARKDRDIKA